MLSGIGPAEHLSEHGIERQARPPRSREEPARPRFFPDHVPLSDEPSSAEPRRTFSPACSKSISSATGGLDARSSKEARSSRATTDAAIPDIQVHTLPWGYPSPNQDGPERPYIDPGHCLTVMPTLIYPKSRGELLLTSSDPGQTPRISTRTIWKRRRTLQLLLTAIRKCREICAHAEMSEHLSEELTPGADRASDAELTEEIRLRAMTVYHPVGSCKMGVDAMAVVDPTLKVRGIEGLRVADASIMPQVTGGNTNAPSMMIGERAAALVQRARVRLPWVARVDESCRATFAAVSSSIGPEGSAPSCLRITLQ